MSHRTLERLFTALANLDAATMQACYAENARFEDGVYRLAGARQIGGMWAMLCGELRLRGIGQWRLEVHRLRVRDDQGRAEWTAHYRFGAKGRKVRNRVYTRFDFDERGLILRQRDQFPFWRWAGQALGLRGWLFGWSTALRQRVQGQAARRLAQHMEKHR